MPFQQLLSLDTIYFNDTSYSLVTDSIIGDTIFLDSLIKLIGDSINTDDQNIDSLTINGTTLTVYIEDGNSASVNLSNTVDSLIFNKSDSLYTYITDSSLADTLWIKQLDSLLSIYGDTIFFNDTSFTLYRDSLLGDSIFLDSLIALLRDSINTDDQNIDSLTINGTTLTVYIEDGNSASVNLSNTVDSLIFNKSDSLYTYITDSSLADTLWIKQLDSLLSIYGDTIFFNDTSFTLYRDSLLGDSIFLDSLITLLRDSINTDDQNIDSVTLNGTIINVYIEDGSSANLDLQPIIDSAIANTPSGSDDQMIDNFSLSGTTLTLEIENDGQPAQTVNLSSLQDGTGTDDQNIDSVTLNGTDLTVYIENGTASMIDLQPIIDSALANQDTTDNDWFKSGGTDLPTNINDLIYTLGQVGIGTSSPLYDLHVDVGNNGSIAIEHDETINGWSQISFKDTAFEKWNVGGLSNTHPDGTNMFYIWQGRNSLGSTINDYRMVINDIGEAGIGTSSPIAQLDVKSKEISTTDYVARFRRRTSGNGLFIADSLSDRDYSDLSVSGDIGLLFDIDNNDIVENDTNGLVIAPWINSSKGKRGGIKIAENGNVGIGARKPGNILTIVDTTNVRNAASTGIFVRASNDSKIRLNLTGNDSTGQQMSLLTGLVGPDATVDIAPYGINERAFLYTSLAVKGLNIISAQAADNSLESERISLYAGSIPIQTSSLTLVPKGAGISFMGVGIDNPLAKIHSTGNSFILGQARYNNLALSGRNILESDSLNLILIPPIDDSGYVMIKDGNSEERIEMMNLGHSFIRSRSVDGTSLSSISFDSIDNFGIGVFPPDAKLDVKLNSNSTASHIAQFSRDNNGYGLFITDSASPGDYNDIVSGGDMGIFFDLDFNNTIHSNTNGLVIAPWVTNSDGAKGIKIMENGFVGIGAISPLVPNTIFSVEGNTTSGDPLATVQNTNLSGTSALTVYSHNWTTPGDGRAALGYGNASYLARLANKGYVWSENGTDLVLDAANDNRLIIDGTTGNIGLAVNGAVHQLQLSTNSAGKPGSGTWTITSDKRLKENITNYTEGLSLIRNIRPVNFNYSNTLNEAMGTNEELLLKKKFQGIIAQELKEIAPDMIKEFTGKDGETYLEVDPNKFTYTLINAVKELDEKTQQIDKQQKQIDDLTNELKEIRKMLEDK